MKDDERTCCLNGRHQKIVGDYLLNPCRCPSLPRKCLLDSANKDVAHWGRHQEAIERHLQCFCINMVLGKNAQEEGRMSRYSGRYSSKVAAENLLQKTESCYTW